MEKKDYILREIEKISILLQYLIGKFMPAKTQTEQQKTEELINKELVENFGNDLDFILNLPNENFDLELSKNKGFNYENIELLADLLYTLGNNQLENNKVYLLKSLELYRYIDEKSKTFSFERSSKINTLKSLL